MTTTDGATTTSTTAPVFTDDPLRSGKDVHAFLQLVRSKMDEDAAPPIFCLAAMNRIMTSQKIYDLLDEPTRELAREIWLRIKQTGIHIRAPRLLFTEEEDTSSADLD